MDKIYKEYIDTFYGGISEDSRIQKTEVYQISQHFDIFSQPKRLVPFRLMKPDETTSYKISAFAYGDSTLIGIGRKSAATNIKIYQKTKSDSIASGWAAADSGESTLTCSASVIAGVIYGPQSAPAYLYGNQESKIYCYGPINGGIGAAFTEQAISAVAVCNGIVTSDGLLIFLTASQVKVKTGNATTPTSDWSSPLVFSDPPWTNSDLCEWGEFIAIGRRPMTDVNNKIGSIVLLWDRVSNDISHLIDFGEGHLILLDNLEGSLLGVSQTGVGEGGVQSKLIIHEYTGGNEARDIIEIVADAGTTLTIDPTITKIREGNKLKFGLKITKGGVSYHQMAVIGRKSPLYPWTFSLDLLVDNDSAVTSIDGTYKLGDTYFIAHNGDGSVNRTDDAANFTSASYISQKRNGESRVQDSARRKKQLVMAGLTCEPLTTGQSASLYYRKDGDSAWTLVRTYSYAASGQDNMGFEAGINNDGTDFPIYKEIEFKAVSSGGAQITGIPYAWKLAGSDVISDS